MITTLPLGYVLQFWRPGSFDRTWVEEFADLGSPERVGEMQLRTWDADGEPHDELCLQMLRGEPGEPVTLGWDAGMWGGQHWLGRVWAGHHRIWIHHEVGRDSILADVVPYGEARPWPANHCAPVEGMELCGWTDGGHGTCNLPRGHATLAPRDARQANLGAVAGRQPTRAG